VCWKMLKSGQREGKGVRLSIQGDWTDKVKHTHRGHTLRHPSERQLKY
jgi:hypothetical protein